MKRFVWFGWLAILLIAAMMPVAASADTLEMKDGTIVHGKFVGGSEFNIRFMVNGQIKYYATKDVLTLSFDSSTSSAPAPAAPATPATSPVASRPPVQPAMPAAAATSSRTITVPAGTVISVRMIDSVDSTTNQVGDQFHASLENELMVNNIVVAPKGADVYGRLGTVKSAGTIRGQSELELELSSIRINGNLVPVSSGDYDVAGKSRGKQSAERIGGIAALGAVIGAIAGGGKGAAIGAAAGAGTGAAVQVLTKGQQVRVPSETVLDFTLSAPIVVAEP